MAKRDHRRAADVEPARYPTLEATFGRRSVLLGLASLSLSACNRPPFATAGAAVHPGFDPQSLVDDAKRLMASKQYREALDKLRRAHEVFPGDPETTQLLAVCELEFKAENLVARARLLAAEGRKDEAVGLLRTVDERAAESETARELLKELEGPQKAQGG